MAPLIKACTRTSTVFAMVVLVSSAALAQSNLRVSAEPIECLPIADNGVGWAKVENNIPDTTVRLNFRRMNDVVEDMYYVRMRPEGGGRYWGIFPKAADEVLDRHDLIERREDRREEYGWAQWWRQKQSSDHRDPNEDLDRDLIRERASVGKQVSRDWFNEMDDETFENWLEQLENEPSEYYYSVHDAQGKLIAKSKTKVVEVRENCRQDLTDMQRGEAENLTIGETSHWQRGEEVFHWLCDGIVTRLNPNGIKRPDEFCRACVIAWWKKPEILVPAAALVGVGGGVLSFDNPTDIPISPVLPGIPTQ